MDAVDGSDSLLVQVVLAPPPDEEWWALLRRRASDPGTGLPGALLDNGRVVLQIDHVQDLGAGLERLDRLVAGVNREFATLILPARAHARQEAEALRADRDWRVLEAEHLLDVAHLG
ncbi:MAG: hypothetical protein ACXVYV_00975 [Gaiellales bacterium]